MGVSEDHGNGEPAMAASFGRVVEIKYFPDLDYPSFARASCAV